MKITKITVRKIDGRWVVAVPDASFTSPLVGTYTLRGFVERYASWPDAAGVAASIADMRREVAVAAGAKWSA